MKVEPHKVRLERDQRPLRAVDGYEARPIPGVASEKRQTVTLVRAFVEDVIVELAVTTPSSRVEEDLLGVLLDAWPLELQEVSPT